MTLGLLIKGRSAGGMSLLGPQFLPFLAPTVRIVRYLCCAALEWIPSSKEDGYLVNMRIVPWESGNLDSHFLLCH